MNIVICGKGNGKLKFANTLLKDRGSSMYFRSIRAFQSWLVQNPTTKSTVLLQVDDDFLPILRSNRHLNYILVMENQPCDDLVKYMDWMYCFDNATPFITKMFTRNNITSIPLTLIKSLDKNRLNLPTSVYDYWFEY
jgi:hypothetical protein